ncbi:protein DD3-3-like [Amphiura filiformis]|uniref:protein DD3-3-like n=1 Tax=Amphiura filiformis TaxID=82378 RepID=UPI003B226D2C
MKSLVLLVGLLMCMVGIHGDMYMHNPRGSNNRLDEAGRERNNGNRMFDSQNNNRGGYNVGSLAYMAGSVLPIEWTNQHSCGDPNAHCEIIIQYMCGDWVRDGASTSTIPENPAQCYNYDCNRDIRYGMHETYDYYLNCKQTEREANLFTADQNLNGDSAKYTRQNPKGTRRAYECPEERDYYPYWRPSPWRDIVVMTNDASRCEYYQAESANVKSRYACVLPQGYIQENINEDDPIIPITQPECESIYYQEAGNPNVTRGEWTEFPAHGIEAPDCREAHWSRDNHLGNGVSGQPNTYNWTLPANLEHERCAMRIRYNISTGEYDGWDPANINADLNNQNRNDPSQLNVAERLGLDEDEAEDRGYVFENNPNVDLFGTDDFTLQLAINTAQYGRTFQDRSHTFAVRKPVGEFRDATIHNLNVRGKRGNIVQVFPAVEYDFVPNTLEVQPGDYVHPQWTGSNTNPNNNDGQGLPGTDRSNMVPLAEQVYSEGGSSYYAPNIKYGHFGRSYPQEIMNSTFAGFTIETMTNMAVTQPNQFRGEMSELDDAGTYFDLGPQKVTQAGTYHYMCTRNNNFSNRSQKGRLIAKNEVVKYESIGYTGGNVTGPSGNLEFQKGTLDHLEDIKLEEWEPERGEWEIEDQGNEVDLPGEGYASKYIIVEPTHEFTTDNATFTISINLIGSSYDSIGVYRSDPYNLAMWEKIDHEQSGKTANIAVKGGGAYVIRGATSNVALIVGIIVAVAVVVLIVGAVVFFRRNPEKWSSITGACSGTGGKV